jgi:beta-N-acetylhexosaminidase
VQVGSPTPAAASGEAGGRPALPVDRAAAERLALELFVIGYEPDELPARVAAWLRQGLAGVILFARNLARGADGAIDVAALCRQTAAIHAAAAAAGALPAICAVDQEGGAVARLRAPFTRLPAMRALAATGDLALLRRAGAQTGRECLAAGFNVDLAPVLDCDTNPANPIIGDRAFARDPDDVIRAAGAFLEGLERAGVRGCGKHFPGHGDTDLDSHLALPRLPFDRARLEQVELRPFAALAPRLGAIMTAHILFPELDPELPATLSPTIIGELLRGHCGFAGVVCSDDLEMAGVAATFSMAERVRLGLAAGVDLFLVCRVQRGVEEAIDEATEILLRGDALAERACRAVARVRRWRATMTRPAPTVAAVAAALAHPDAAALRSGAGLGTV